MSGAIVEQGEKGRRDAASALQLAAIVESSDDAIIGKNLDGTILTWNKGAERIYGYTAEEMIGRSKALLIPPDRQDEMPRFLERIRSGERIEHYETVRTRKDGKLIHISLTVSPIKDAQGRIVGASSIGRDITERKLAEERQQRAAAYSRSLIEASLDPLVTISPEGKITDVNEATVQATGVPQGQLIGTDFSDYFTEPDKAREGYRRVFSEGQVRDYPLTIKHRRGKPIDVLYNASVYRDEQGKVLGVFAAARDITTQKQASRYARSLIEASLDPLVTISPAGKITDVNEATVQVTGVPREQLIGTDFSSYFTEPEKAQEGYLQVFSEGQVRDYPLAIRHATGKIIHVLYNATVYRDDKGKVRGVFAAARDITERRKADVTEREEAEQAVRKSEALAAVGQLASQLAHEINNPLTVMVGYLSRIKDLNDGNPKVTEAAEKAEKATFRVRELTQGLLSLARASQMTMAPLQLEKVLEETRKGMADDFASHKVQVEWSVPPVLPALVGSPDHLQQVFANLFLNAQQAMQNGGTLAVTARSFGEEVRVSVSDTGMGIPPSNLKRIFQPFFTTKPLGKGTGLGLAVCDSVVAQHKGRIEVQSEPGKGSTFTVILPAGRAQ